MDYTKEKAAFYGVLLSPGRHVLFEKTIIEDKFWECCGTYSEFAYTKGFRIMADTFSNNKLWKLISFAQGLKQNTVKHQQFERASSLRDIERTCAEVIAGRMKNYLKHVQKQ